MKLTTQIAIILLALLSSGCIQQSVPVVVTIEQGKPAVVNIEPGTSTTINIVPALTPAPTSTPYPKPSYTPTLRPYLINKNHDIWHAQDPSSYITPNNEWVKYYASQLYVDYDGYIKYKNVRVPALIDENSKVMLWTNETFLNNYIYDWVQFGNGQRGSIPNDDYWANADYYLTHGMTGDCEDWAIAVTSMMLSGEMSTWNNETLTKQVIPAKVILGYSGGERDAWAEYEVYGYRFRTSTSNKPEGSSEPASRTIFSIESDWRDIIPAFECTDKYFRTAK